MSITYTHINKTLGTKIDEAERVLAQETAAGAQEQERTGLVFCRRLIASVRAVLDEKKSEVPNSGWPVIVVGLLVKTISTVRSAYTLGACGHGREMPILVRSALESLITATFIAKEDSERRARRWAQHAVVTKARFLKRYPTLSSEPEHKKIGESILAQAQDLEKLFPNPLFWASGLNKGSLRDLAIDVDMLWYYDMVYWSGSQGTHGTAIAVDAFIEVLPDGEPSFKAGLSSRYLRGELAACCDVLLRAMKVLNESCNLGIDKLLGELIAEYKVAFSDDPLAEIADRRTPGNEFAAP